MEQERMTQKKIAKKLEMSESMLSKILSDGKTPSPKKARRLAELSGIDEIVWLYSPGHEIGRRLKAKYGEFR